MNNNLVIDAKDIVKKFYIGEPNELEILHGMTFSVPKGQFVSIVGQSGSGKSTLMNILGALDRPTSGTYFLDGTDISRAKDKQLSEIRNRQIGFVFQTFNLIARTSALKNVELPMMYGGVDSKTRRQRAMELLEIVEMTERSSHVPSELSGGQKQRVAIARAMANNPSIILADEPTGALDSKTGRLVMDLFHKLHREQGKTIVLITHNNELAAETERIITIADGNIIRDSDGSAGQFISPLQRPLSPNDIPAPQNTTDGEASPLSETAADGSLQDEAEELPVTEESRTETA